MTKAIKLKHSVVIALLAIAITTPVVVNAYSDNEVPVQEPEQFVTQPEVKANMIVETPVTDVAVDTTVETTVDDVEVPPIDVVDEDETPVVEPVMTEVTIGDAITIAEAEHPGVEVVLAKVKLAKLNEEKVYKVVFVDGWRIYVAADNGEILRIKDPADKKHDCSKRGQNATRSWQNERKKNKRTSSDQRSSNNNHRDWKNKFNRANR